jgi:GTPase SAR1 family protein
LDTGEIQVFDLATGTTRASLQRQDRQIHSVACSPRDDRIAISAGENTVFTWNHVSGATKVCPSKNPVRVNCLAWSPDGKLVALAREDHTLHLWDVDRDVSDKILIGHSQPVNAVAWSPDGRFLASGSSDGTVRLWDDVLGTQIHAWEGHASRVNCIAWSPDSRFLTSGSDDRSIRVWDPVGGDEIGRLEQHTGPVRSLSFSYDGSVLASQSASASQSDNPMNSVLLWRVESWTRLSSISGEQCRDIKIRSADEQNTLFPTLRPRAIVLAFRPYDYDLATAATSAVTVRIANVSRQVNEQSGTDQHDVKYRNAKVVLVGEQSVGKSGLALRLTGQGWHATEPTHNRHVWRLWENPEAKSGDATEVRNIFLWDLAGQRAFRIIHLLHLSDVAVAVVVFDSESADPLDRILFWDHALRDAQKEGLTGTRRLPKFLVAGKSDLAGIGTNRTRIREIVRDLGYDDYVETSAKYALGTDALKDKIIRSVQWDSLTPIYSSHVFIRVMRFVMNASVRNPKSVLSTMSELYETYGHSSFRDDSITVTRTQFETAIFYLENAGLVRRFSFGSYVLLRPEKLDTYASALLNAVREAEDGLGSIPLKRVEACDFPIPADERIQDKSQERTLIVEMVRDLLGHELAMRENVGSAQGDECLVFPSQASKPSIYPDEPDNMIAVIEFRGRIQLIYASLATRIANSGLFREPQVYKGAVTFTATAGGTCGLLLRDDGIGPGHLTLFHVGASNRTLQTFEEFVVNHLRIHAVRGTIQMHRIVHCPNTECGKRVNPSQMQDLINDSRNQAFCSYCGTPLVFDHSGSAESGLQSQQSQDLIEMEKRADHTLSLAVAAMTLRGKDDVDQRDVFISYNSHDAKEVSQYAKELTLRGIRPYFQMWDSIPGQEWMDQIVRALASCKSAAIFCGEHGLGPYQKKELVILLERHHQKGIPIIPCILVGCPMDALLGSFLGSFQWVDFRDRDDFPSAFQQLVHGINQESVGIPSRPLSQETVILDHDILMRFISQDELVFDEETTEGSFNTFN